MKRLERLRSTKGDWESDHERWLREAVLRLEGVDGLERLARKAKRPQTCLAWCEAVSDALLADLESTCRDPLEDLALDDAARRPRLATPSFVALIEAASSSMTLSDVDQNAMIDAMRVAAEKRVDGILGHSRRRHYSHAALLVGQCASPSRHRHVARHSTPG